MKLISVHTPKAGATSIGRSLQKAFGPRFLSECFDDPADPVPERNIDPVRYFSLNRVLPRKIGCIHGHFHPGQFNLGRDLYLFTMLRHPVSNIISIHSSWRTLPAQGQALHDYAVTNRLNVVELAQLPALRWLYSRTYFGGFDMGRFDMIGNHENRTEVLSKLGTALGMPIDLHEHANSTPVSKEREALMADHVLVRRLHTILSDDIRFYEQCCG